MINDGAFHQSWVRLQKRYWFLRPFCLGQAAPRGGSGVQQVASQNAKKRFERFNLEWRVAHVVKFRRKSGLFQGLKRLAACITCLDPIKFNHVVPLSRDLAEIVVDARRLVFVGLRNS